MVEPTRPGTNTEPNDTEHGEVPPATCSRCHTLAEDWFSYCPKCGVNLASGLPVTVFGDPWLGAVIADRYRLLAKLGVGGMGTVYKVEHVRMAKLMAMKLLHANLSRDENMVARFKREARAISALKSRHVVQVFDVGEANGLFYILMEYLQGRDLGDLLVERRQLSLKRSQRIVHQVCAGLADAHRQGIVHRDLKPENIFICAPGGGEDEVIKLLDFGLAKLHQRDESIAATQRGLILGTPHYMSPEQIEADDVSPESDLYSLCAVIYKTLSGAPPFPGEHALKVLNAHLSQAVPRLSSSHPELACLDSFFEKGLAKSKLQRFRSTQELLRAFDAAIVQHLRVSEAHLPPANANAPLDLGRSDTEWLLAPIDRAALPKLATAKDFDRFEWAFRIKRISVALGSLLLLSTALWALIWGIGMGRFFDDNTESEPNNDLREANPIRLGQPILGTLGEIPGSYRADRDFFVLLEPPPERMLHLSLSPIPELDLVLELIDRNGQLLFSQNASPAGFGEVIPNFPAPRDALYVLVRELWKQGTPATPKPDAYYALLIEAREAMSGEEREPNNSLETASTLERNLAQGYLCSPGDLDVYMLPQPPSRLELQLSGVPRCDHQVRVLDASGAELFLCDARGIGDAEHCIYELPRDVRKPIYLEVSAVRGFSAEFSYQLSVQAARTSKP